MLAHSKPTIRSADIEAVLSCLESGMVAEGQITSAFEEACANAWFAYEGVAVGSGSQALYLSLRASGVGSGSKVIVPTLVCAEVLGVILSLGAIPILTDVDEKHGVLAVEDIPIGEHIDAIVVPFLFGRPVDANQFERFDVPLIADCAHSLPSERNILQGYKFCILSFEATKMMASGEGGLALAFDKESAKRLRDQKLLAETEFKLNLFPMSNIQSALALSQLRQAHEFSRRRKELAKSLIGSLQEIEDVKCFFNGDYAPFRLPMYYLGSKYDVDDVIREFEAKGISCRRPVSRLLHHIFASHRSFKKAEDLFDRTFSLPFYPSLSEQQESLIIRAIKEVFQ